MAKTKELSTSEALAKIERQAVRLQHINEANLSGDYHLDKLDAPLEAELNGQAALLGGKFGAIAAAYQAENKAFFSNNTRKHDVSNLSERLFHQKGDFTPRFAYENISEDEFKKCYDYNPTNTLTAVQQEKSTLEANITARKADPQLAGDATKQAELATKEKELADLSGFEKSIQDSAKSLANKAAKELQECQFEGGQTLEKTVKDGALEDVEKNLKGLCGTAYHTGKGLKHEERTRKIVQAERDNNGKIINVAGVGPGSVRSDPYGNRLSHAYGARPLQGNLNPLRDPLHYTTKFTNEALKQKNILKKGAALVGGAVAGLATDIVVDVLKGTVKTVASVFATPGFILSQKDITNFDIDENNVKYLAHRFMGGEAQIREAFNHAMALPGRKPGDPIFLTLGKNVSSKYVEKMRAEADRRGVELKLATACKNNMNADPKLRQKLVKWEGILKYDHNEPKVDPNAKGGLSSSGPPRI